MNTNIHRVKRIEKSEIKEHIKDKTGEKFYTMDISFIYDELGTYKESYSNLTMHEYVEVETELTLYANTREALEIKSKVLISEVA